MKTKAFCLDDEGIKLWAAFLNDPTITIKDRLFSPETNEICPTVYYAFEDAQDQDARDATMLHDEQDHLRELVKVARCVAEDQAYLNLHSETQRKMHLLAFYDLRGADAAQVMNLVLPEMAMLLNVEWGRKT